MLTLISLIGTSSSEEESCLAKSLHIARSKQSVRKALQYDQMGAMQHDNGIFWIDYDSMLKFYRSIYFNWNPGLFASRQVCVQREQTSPRGGLLPCFLVSFLTATPRKLELESSRAGK